MSLMITSLIQNKRKKVETSAQKKRSWKCEYVEALTSYIKEYKTVHDFNGIDFKADLKELRTILHRCMASRFPGDFG